MAEGKLNNYLIDWVKRAQQMDTHIDNLKEDRKELDKELKSQGFEPKVMNKLIKIMEADRDKVSEEQSLLDTYAKAIGYQLPLPL